MAKYRENNIDMDERYVINYIVDMKVILSHINDEIESDD